MKPDSHEIYKRRGANNIWLGLIMAGLVIIIFFVTVVKLMNGSSMQAYDHTLRPELIKTDENE